MPAKFCHEEGLILLGGDWYKPHTNIYLLNHRLISARRRRAVIHKQNLLVSKSSLGDLENKFCLLEADVINPPENNNLSKKPGRSQAKTIIAQQ